MDQKKIGEFISTCRKNKNLTQQELADLLHVTDRAISNWERGIRMPDVSFFRPLCEILDITINELLKGERIDKEDEISTSEEQLLDVLTSKEESRKKIIWMYIILVIILIGLLSLIGILYYRGTYPNIELYQIEAWHQDPDKEYTLDKAGSYKEEGNTYNIYYYGLEKVNFCNSKKCYDAVQSIKHHQIDKTKLKKYLESSMMGSIIDSHIYYDGGTTTYQSDNYMIIFCNTTEGNKDIYFGVEDMLDRVDGEFCGHTKSDTKTFTRTYKVEAIYQDEVEEFINVTLRVFQGEVETVKIDSSYPLQVGKNYEFTFITDEEFTDNISNIFNHSSLIKVKETDRIGLDQIQDKIEVNRGYIIKDELNEIKEVSMKIKKGSLTPSSATIIINDLSGGKWIYGSSYIIEKYVNEEWIRLDYVRDNVAFNSMAYTPDPSGVLEMKMNWKSIYGVLQKGRYRIVKYALPELNRAVDENDRKYFSVEFDIG